MRLGLLLLSAIVAVSCMKSREEYQEAIMDVRQEQEADALRRHEEIQREEAPLNQRSRGSNDVEGMGMDE